MVLWIPLKRLAYAFFFSLLCILVSNLNHKSELWVQLLKVCLKCSLVYFCSKTWTFLMCLICSLFYKYDSWHHEKLKIFVWKLSWYSSLNIMGYCPHACDVTKFLCNAWKLELGSVSFILNDEYMAFIHKYM